MSIAARHNAEIRSLLVERDALREAVARVEALVTDGHDGVFDVRQWGERGTPFSNGGKQMARRIRAALDGAE